MIPPSLVKRAAIEFIATAFLLIAVVGSGIAAQRLSPTDVGLQLLESSIAAGAALVALILAFGPWSGAHMNPVVTISTAALGETRWRELPAYVAAQICGAAIGAILANLMFGLPAVFAASTVRSSSGLWLGEVIATLGLVLFIHGVARLADPRASAAAVGAYIAGAYWFTSSTSFANPAVTLARTLTDTFAGIAPASAPAFIAAQLVGAAIAIVLIRLLFR